MVELLGLALLMAVVIWLFRSGRHRSPPGEAQEPIDQEALEAAEREVQQLDLHQRPDEGSDGDDWGPGASRHRQT